MPIALFKPLLLKPQRLVASTIGAAALSISLAAPLASAAEDDTTPSEVIQHTPNAFIKDDLFIYMHTGSSKKFRVQGSINAGTPIEVLDTDDETGFVQIKDPKGRTGWIEKVNTSTETSIRSQYQALQEQYNIAVDASESEQSNVDELARQLNLANKNNQQLTQQIANLESDKQALQQKLNKSSSDKDQTMMLYGSSIAVVGILFGLLMPSLVRRRRRSDGWA